MVTNAGKSAIIGAMAWRSAVGVLGDEVLLHHELEDVGDRVDEAGEADGEGAVGDARRGVDAG